MHNIFNLLQELSAALKYIIVCWINSLKEELFVNNFPKELNHFINNYFNNLKFPTH